jgi:hypothetical protein
LCRKGARSSLQINNPLAEHKACRSCLKVTTNCQYFVCRPTQRNARLEARPAKCPLSARCSFIFHWFDVWGFFGGLLMSDCSVFDLNIWD